MVFPQPKAKSRFRLAFAAAALVCSALIFNLCAAAPAKAGDKELFQFPMDDTAVLHKKMTEQCEDENFVLKTPRVSSLVVATTLDISFGFFGLANGALAIFNAVFPNNPLDAKLIDCPVEVKKAVEAAKPHIWRRDMVAKRGLHLSEWAPSNKALPPHRGYVSFFDMTLFRHFRPGLPDDMRLNIEVEDKRRYDASVVNDSVLAGLQAAEEAKRQVVDRPAKAVVPAPSN